MTDPAPPTPTEPDWRAYAGRLENIVAEQTVELIRLGETVRTLSDHVSHLTSSGGAPAQETTENDPDLGRPPNSRAEV